MPEKKSLTLQLDEDVLIFLQRQPEGPSVYVQALVRDAIGQAEPGVLLLDTPEETQAADA